MKTVLLVQGANHVDDVPRLAEIVDQAEIRFASNTDEMAAGLPGAEVLLAWDFHGANLSDVWSRATDLRWIHRCGAGVDAALFPELVASNVTLTNARGVFDQGMAEWVLGTILMFAKQFMQSFELQRNAEWLYRRNEMIAGKKVLIVGAGSIGRHIGRLLQASGMSVEAVGRSARDGDADFATVHAIDDLLNLLPRFDYVVLITPLTEQTRNLFGAAEFAAMAPHARFINLGRGPLVVEADLLAALEQGGIAGAALDVFVEEPLPAGSPFWRAPNCFVSPHVSGDYIEYDVHIMDQFLQNWQAYRDGRPLANLVDKQLGFAAPSSD